MKLRSLFGLLAFAYFGFGLLLLLFQRSFIYMPVGDIPHDYPVERLTSGDETIEVVVLNGGKPDAVIYFGGNAEWVVANAPGFARSLPDQTVYLVNYRGYAGSTGSPSEAALYQDALNIHDLIRDRHQNISVIGRSLGSGVATYLAAKRPVEKLVLVTPFDSILNVAREHYGFYPVSLMLKDRFDSVGRVKDIRADTLVVIAAQDTVIAYPHSRRLIGAFPPAQVTVQTLEGVGHNDLSAHPGYHASMGEFLSSETSKWHEAPQSK